MIPRDTKPNKATDQPGDESPSDVTATTGPDQSCQTEKQARGVIARNVMSNWFWYGLIMVSGFVIPRCLDEYLGAEMLGIWDFGWSLIFYVRWLQLGISGSIARYVARYRAKQDWDSLNRAVNSSLAVLALMTVVGIPIVAGLVALVPKMLPTVEAAIVREAQWVALLLLLCVLMDSIGSSVNSVITGCERFDTLNIIRGGRDGLVFVAQVSLLLAGFGIVAMAAVVLAGNAVCLVAWFVAAKRVCPQVRFSPKYVEKVVAREMVVFGGKNIVQTSARSALYQVNSICIAAFLGPATLAVFARQRALVLQALNFVKHYAQVFIPRSSALHAQGDRESLQRLAVASSKYGLYMTLPVILILLTMGGPLLRLWMGADFEAPYVLAILALGHVFSVPQQGMYMLLLGMNKHARPALYEVAASAIGIVGGGVVLGVFDGGLLAAAAAIALPVGVFGGVLVPIYACRMLQISPASYFIQISKGPMLAAMPLLTCLVGARLLLPNNPIQSLLVGVGVGGLVTTAIYWRWVVPRDVKQRIRQRLANITNKRSDERNNLIVPSATEMKS